MELRDLRYFCTAAETEHISKAAEKLGVSQPFLTKIITQLEEELGCELFDHVGRRVKLNRYGKLLLESANKILDEIDLGPYMGDYKDEKNPHLAEAQERHRKLKEFLANMGW